SQQSRVAQRSARYPTPEHSLAGEELLQDRQSEGQATSLTDDQPSIQEGISNPFISNVSH
ncbi:hypothetical protein VR46_30210, partial [Streptomyces sp. NRRL S-444]